MRNHAVARLKQVDLQDVRPNDLEFLFKTKGWGFKNPD